MGKKKGVVWDFFKIKGIGVICKYCPTEYKHPNSCKMEKHIKKCFKCPEGLKSILSVTTSTATTSKSKSRNVTSKPLSIEVDEEIDLTQPGPSSADSMGPPKSWPSPSPLSTNSATSDSGTTPIYSPRFSGLLNKFMDQMDSQTNVSLKFLYLRALRPGSYISIFNLI